MKKFVILFITFWIVLSVFRTLFNFSKIFTEERVWIGISDEQKREKIFGPVYSFLQIIKQQTIKNDVVLMKTDDLKNFYIARYVLYPTRVTRGVNNVNPTFSVTFLSTSSAQEINKL